MVVRTTYIGGNTGCGAEARKDLKPDIDKHCVLETNKYSYKQAAYNEGRRRVNLTRTNINNY